MEGQMTEGKALQTTSQLQTALAVATERKDISALRDVAAMAAALQKGAKSRGLGIADENQAAEVVIRAERAIGQNVIALRAAGAMATEADGARMRSTQVGPGGTRQKPKLVPVGVPEGVPLTLRGLGLSYDMANNCVRLASLPDSGFEDLVQAAREKTERLAKVDFYRAARPTPPPFPHDAVRDERKAAGETESPESIGFGLVRTGIHRLLGWVVDDEGAGTATKNELLLLPDDQLAELKGLVEALAGAYAEARKARRPLQAVA